MPRRIPTPEDFPSNMTLSIVPPPLSSSASSVLPPNVLLLLHGFGDTNVSFASIARSMALPETLCISIRAPMPLPFGLGSPSADGSFHWGDDVLLDPSKPDGGVDIEGAGYKRAVRILANEVIQQTLVGKCGYERRDILILGMGQGGTVGLGVARCLDDEPMPNSELGGVISLGGAMPVEWKLKPGGRKSKTALLVTHGKSSSVVTTAKESEIREAFEFVSVHQWNRRGDGMATNREEMLPIMKFLAGRLRSRAGVPKGAVEMS